MAEGTLAAPRENASVGARRGAEVESIRATARAPLAASLVALEVAEPGAPSGRAELGVG